MTNPSKRSLLKQTRIVYVYTLLIFWFGLYIHKSLIICFLNTLFSIFKFFSGWKNQLRRIRSDDEEGKSRIGDKPTQMQYVKNIGASRVITTIFLYLFSLSCLFVWFTHFTQLSVFVTMKLFLFPANLFYQHNIYTFGLKSHLQVLFHYLKFNSTYQNYSQIDFGTIILFISMTL